MNIYGTLCARYLLCNLLCNRDIPPTSYVTSTNIPHLPWNEIYIIDRCVIPGGKTNTLECSYIDTSIWRANFYYSTKHLISLEGLPARFNIRLFPIAYLERGQRVSNYLKNNSGTTMMITIAKHDGKTVTWTQQS